MATGRKQVTFDLDTNALKIYYPSESWNGAYDIIKRHMLKNGFSWQQGSVYVSDSPMLGRDVPPIIETLVENNSWLNVCMRDCRQTNIGNEHSQNHLFDKDAPIPMRENSKENISMQTGTLSDYMTLIKQIKSNASEKPPRDDNRKKRDDRQL
jgi:virulence-associated protein VapD